MLASANRPMGIAVDATSVYWTEDTSADCYGKVMKVPLAGGTATTLAAGQNAPAPSRWTDERPPARCRHGSLKKAPIDGGPSTMLASGQSEPGPIAIDATNVYWVAGVSSDWSSSADLNSVPKGGGMPTTLVKNQNLQCIAVHAASIDWGDAVRRRIVRLTPK